MTPIDSKAYKAAAAAIKDTFGKDPIPVRGGGSIPICSLFEQELGIKIVFMGFGLDSDNLHSPNEKFNLDNYYKGIETIPYFHKHFAEMWSDLALRLSKKPHPDKMRFFNFDHAWKRKAPHW